MQHRIVYVDFEDTRPREILEMASGVAEQTRNFIREQQATQTKPALAQAFATAVYGTDTGPDGGWLVLTSEFVSEAVAGRLVREAEAEEAADEAAHVGV